MHRMTALAALAVAAALAAPASAASIRVSTEGKTPEQVKAEVMKAAAHVCRAEGSDWFQVYEHEPCAQATARSALTQASDLAQSKVATR
jgi:hypothetical protein